MSLNHIENNKNRKVAIIGSGYVGASIAYAMNLRGLAREIVLIDSDSAKAHAEALDIRHGIPLSGNAFVYAGDYCDCHDCDLIIITAGRNRQSGESRLQLAEENVKILRAIISRVSAYYNQGTIMLVSNPVDVLTYCCDLWMGLPPGRVFGTGCILDTSRLVSSLSDYLGINTNVINVSVIGEHGASQMPLWSRASIAGYSIEEYCKSVEIPWGVTQRENMMERIREMGTNIIAAKSRTHYGIATCVCYLSDCILNHQSTIASVSSVFHGEYGIKDVALSVPSIITSDGVSRRLEEPWTNEEIQRFNQSADILRETLHRLRTAHIL